jgi:hypothetical protein
MLPDTTATAPRACRQQAALARGEAKLLEQFSGDARHREREMRDLTGEFNRGQMPEPLGLCVGERAIEPSLNLSPILAPGDCSLDHLDTDVLTPLEPAALT